MKIPVKVVSRYSRNIPSGSYPLLCIMDNWNMIIRIYIHVSRNFLFLTILSS